MLSVNIHYLMGILPGGYKVQVEFLGKSACTKQKNEKNKLIEFHQTLRIEYDEMRYDKKYVSNSPF